MGLIFSSCFDWLGKNFLDHLEFYKKPYQTGKILTNLYTVENRGTNIFIYSDGVNAICFDAGYDDDSRMDEFKRIGIAFNSITHLFLTHSDVDHAEGIDLFHNAEIYLSADEVQLINGSVARGLGGLYFNKRIDTYRTLRDGDEIRIGDITVRATATPGSMSYLVNDEILVCGDALILKNGCVEILWPIYNMDTEGMKRSIGRLAKLKGVKLMVTAHTGGTDRFEVAMKKWLE